MTKVGEVIHVHSYLHMFTNIYLVRKKQSNPKMIMTIALAFYIYIFLHMINLNMCCRIDLLCDSFPPIWIFLISKLF